MKRIPPLLKLIVVSVIVAVLGYVGLDIPSERVEEALDEQFTSVEEPTAIEDGIYEVVSVIDGDTFVAMRNGEDMAVRVIGIDTPETEFSSRGAECYGAEATDEARRLLAGTSVQLTTDSTQDTYDTYDRLLAYVTMEDGRDFGAVMIETGFAEEFTYRDPYINQATYQTAEREAREVSRGLWQCE